MIYCFVAMEREAEKIEFNNVKIIGINAVSMPLTKNTDTIINIGYCGSNSLKISTIVEPDYAIDFYTNEKFKIDKIFGFPNYPCYTASTFIEKSHTDTPCIYDMELAKIAKLPHKKLYSLKMVSDNLNEKVCEAFHGEGLWEIINKILKTTNFDE